jgi:methylthioribose-1-phosphate isomerase
MCNKIGTYLKALAALDNHIPFYVALPVSTIDWSINNGVRDIPIEQRAPEEVSHITGLGEDGQRYQRATGQRDIRSRKLCL